MKKYLLLGIITLAGIFNFSSAEFYNGMSFTCSVGGQIEGYNECSDDYLDLNIDKGNYILNVNSQLDSFNFNGSLNLGGDSCTLNNGKSHLSFPGNYDLICSEQADITLNIFNVNAIVGDTPALVTFSISQNSGGGTSGEGGEGGNIVEGGINAFSGIIDRIGGIFGEFGPYIIYIAIACLGINLLFKALKSLLGFTNNNAKNSIGGRTGMKERRKRRRQLRRRTYSFDEIKYNPRDYYPITYPKNIKKARFKKRTIQRRKRKFN